MLDSLYSGQSNVQLANCYIEVSEDGESWTPWDTNLYLQGMIISGYGFNFTGDNSSGKILYGSSAAVEIRANNADVYATYPYARFVLSYGVTVTTPINGEFIPIDGSTITLNSNGQLQATGGSSQSGNRYWKVISGGGEPAIVRCSDDQQYGNTLLTFSTINNTPIISNFSGYQANISTPNNIGDGLSIINNQDGTMTTAAGGYSTYGTPTETVSSDYGEDVTASIVAVSGQSTIQPVFELVGTNGLSNLISISRQVYQNTDMSVAHYELQLTVVYNGTTLFDHQNINTYNAAYLRWTKGSGRITIQTANGSQVPSPTDPAGAMFYFTCYDPATGSKIAFSETDTVVVTLQYIYYEPGVEIPHMIENKYINEGAGLPNATVLADGTYVLKATVSNGEVTYQWVLEE